VASVVFWAKIGKVWGNDGARLPLFMVASGKYHGKSNHVLTFGNKNIFGILM
jgi:hypothetical protein